MPTEEYARITASVVRDLADQMSWEDSPMKAPSEAACNSVLCLLVTEIERVQRKEVKP